MKRAIVVEPKSPKPANATRLMCLSDAHGKIGCIPEDYICPCDIMIFAGDFSNFGNPDEVRGFVEWVHRHSAPANVVIAGNADLPFDTAKLDRFRARYSSCFGGATAIEDVKALVAGDPQIRYLEHSACTIGGITIFGSPYSPAFLDLAFNTTPERAREVWGAVPAGIDVLVTHTPPRGVFDRTNSGAHVGCPELRAAVDRVSPALCVFGHIHEANGVTRVGDTLFCNVALASDDETLNKPMYIDIIES